MKFILNIGMHKTGSSAIQQSFSKFSVTPKHPPANRFFVNFDVSLLYDFARDFFVLV